jgi:hypothetical protein
MRSSFAALLLLLIPHLAHAGPWLKDTGAGYAKLSTTYFQSEGYYRASEETDFSFSSYSLSLYSEIGLPGPFQAIVQIPFVFAANSNASDVAFRNADFGDGRFSLEWAPWDGLNLVVGMDLRSPALYACYQPATPGRAQRLANQLSRPGRWKLRPHHAHRLRAISWRNTWLAHRICGLSKTIWVLCGWRRS